MKTKILVLLGCSLFVANLSFGQVRVVNSITNISAPNSSAFIDASSNSTLNSSTNIGKGLLFPRVNLTTFASFGGSPVGVAVSYPNRYDGMIVYNNATGTSSIGSVAVTPGFYFYNNKTTSVSGGKWVRINDSQVNTLPQGATLPAITATTNIGDLFYLSAGSTGLYVFNGTAWVSATSTVARDATLTGDGNAATPLGIADNGVNSAKIANDAIVDADVNSAAAIALSKLASGTNIVTSLAAPSGSEANGGSITTNVLTLSLANATNPGVVSAADYTTFTNKADKTRQIATAAKSGLVGGGDLSADRSLSLDITGLDPLTSINDADEVAVYDASTSTVLKISRANFLSGVTGALTYQGTWDASAPAGGSPALVDGTPADKGKYYVVSAAGSQTFNSVLVSFNAGDWVLSNGAFWEKLTNSVAVSSVFGRTGSITATAGDYTAAKITNTPAGTIVATNAQAAIDELESNKLPKALTSANIFVGNGSGLATGVIMGGDVAIDNIGVTTIGTDKITTTKILNANVTPEKLTAGPGVADRVALANAAGVVTFGTLPATSVTGANVTSTDLTVTGGTGAALTALTLDIKDDAVVTAKIKDANVTTAKINDAAVTTSKVADGAIATIKLAAPAGAALGNGTAGDVLSSNGSGQFEWINVPSKLALAEGTFYVGNASGLATETLKSAVPLSGFGAASADVAMGNNKITGLAEPAATSDAATKAYADTKEATANKSTATALGTSDVLFPTQNAVKTYVDAEVLAITVPAATALVQGKLKLAGDLGGTADAPLIGDSKVTSAKIADGTIAAADLGEDAVETLKIRDSNVTSAKLAVNAVTTTKIAAQNVTAQKLAGITTDGTAGQVLASNADGTLKWADGLTTSLEDGRILVGSSLGKATAVIPTGNVTIDNLGATTITPDAVTSARIKDDEIVNADINASAAIADTKLATITTPGKVANSATTATDANTASTIVLRDVSGNFAAGDIAVNGGDLTTDQTTASVFNTNATTLNMGGEATAITLGATTGTTTVGNTLVTSALRIPTAAQTGYILKSDGAGNASWNAPTTNYKGIWDVQSPLSATGNTVGDYYVVSADGIQSTINYYAGGMAIWSGTEWQSIGSTNAVNRVNTLVGDVDIYPVLSGNNLNLIGSATSVDLSTTPAIAVATATANAAKAEVDVVEAGAGLSIAGAYVPNGTAHYISTATSLKDADNKLDAQLKTVLDAATHTGDVTGTTALTIAADAVTSAKIKDGEIVAADMADGAVTSAKILDGTVANADLASNAVDNANIVNGAVSFAKLADGAVTKPKLSAAGGSNGQVLGTDGTNLTWVNGLTNALTSGKILVGSDTNLATPMVMAGDVTIDNTATTAIGADKVLTGMIATGAVGTTDLADNAVTTDKILDATIAAADLANDAVETAKILNAAVTVDKLATDAVETAKIKNLNVTAEKLTAGLGVANRIAIADASGNVTYNTLSSSVVTGVDVTSTDLDVTGAGAVLKALTLNIKDGAVTNAKIAAEAITTSEILAGTILVSDLANEAVETAKIKDAAVTKAKLSVTNAGTTGQMLTTGDGTNLVWVTPSNGVTDLSYTPAAATGTVNSNTGIDATIPAATITEAGLLTAADKIKYDALITNATHTGDVTGAIALTIGADKVLSSMIKDGEIVAADLSAMGAAANQVLTYDGAVWAPTTLPVTTDATTLAKGIVQLAGDLDGNAVSPQIKANVIVDADVNTAANIALTKLADGASIVTSLNTPTGSNANGGSIASNVLTLSLANTTNPGALSSADWNTFNNKVNSTREINTVSGSGLTGGGDLSANRSLSLDIHNITTLSGSIDNADEIPVYDATGTVVAKVTRANFLSGVTGALVYQGTWNATTNIPALNDVPLVTQQGKYYVVTVAGSQDLGSGSITYAAGDWVVNNGTTWEKLINSVSVPSVFTRTGPIVAEAGDYTAAQVTNAAAGNIIATTVQSAINELDAEKLTNVLTSAYIFVGDGSNKATGVPLIGDASIINTGELTISDNAVTAVKINADAVETAKIKDAAVTLAKLSAGATGSSGKVLASDGTNLVWASGLTNTLTTGSIFVGTANVATALDAKADGQILIGNGTTIASQAISGDASLTNTGVLTLVADAVTATKLASDAVETAKIKDANVTVTKLKGIAANGTNGQVLASDATGGLKWVDGLTNALATGSIFVGTANVATAVDAKADGQILIGNGTTLASQAITGDVTLTNAGVTAISSGVIVDGDVSASAGILGTKIAPDFGSQPVVTTGTVGGSTVTGSTGLVAGTATGLVAGTLVINDATAGTSNAVTIKAPSDVNTNYTLTLPVDQASADGQVLTNDGTGVLRWGTASATTKVVVTVPVGANAGLDNSAGGDNKVYTVDLNVTGVLTDDVVKVNYTAADYTTAAGKWLAPGTLGVGQNNGIMIMSAVATAANTVKVTFANMIPDTTPAIEGLSLTVGFSH